MAVFGLVFLIIAVSIAGLAIGVIFGRAPIKGTCSGGTCPKAFGCVGCQQQKTMEKE
ncbi:MAG: hypothetical protein KAS85_00405 [Rhodobacteraceae bacterium]|nr:hypothetical protein [Paracoccaceae bacterium]